MNVDLFAGPGGWDEGLALLGRTDVVGLEWDSAACKTAKAAGHQRIRCDVTTYPTDAFGRVEGLIGSPSCTLFSAAGNGVGNLVTHILAAGIVRMMHGDDCRAEIREAIYPTTLAMREAANAKRKPEKRWTQERVESQAKDDTFVACLILEPARYILALGVEWVALEQVPEVLPLWKVYVRELRALGYFTWTGVLNSADYGVPQTRQRAILMAHKSVVVQPPEPTHTEHPQSGVDLFGGQLAPWVTMAEGLGPDWTVRLADETPGSPAADAAGQWNVRPGEQSPVYVNGNQPNAGRRSIHEPAPTILFGHRSNDVRWVFERPATTVVGSFCPDVIAAPGYRMKTSRQNAAGSVRVSIEEAGVLQSFPADYPWSGSKSKRSEQVGNAIPPVLAMHILAALGVGTIKSEVAA